MKMKPLILKRLKGVVDMKKLRTAVFIPMAALIVVGLSTAVSADAASVGETSTSSVTMNPITLAEHTSYVSDAYFGVINVGVADKNVVAATSDSQGHVVISAVGSGTTRVLYWFKPTSTDTWTSAIVPVTVSGTAVSATVPDSSGLVFSQSNVSIANGGTYTAAGITLNGAAVKANSLLWVASSGSVVTVEPNTGKVTAVGVGTAVLYAIDPVTKAAANINLSVY